MTRREIAQKLQDKGKYSLTDPELLSLVGGIELELARRIIYNNYTLWDLSKWTVEHFMNQYGISKLNALKIVAALDLCKRLMEEESRKVEKITCSGTTYQLLKPYFHGLIVEKAHIIYLNKSHNVIKVEEHSSGSCGATLFDTVVAFKRALELTAHVMILSHNHPSNSPKPSEADLRITKTFVSAGNVLSIKVIDHLIMTDHGYYSFCDEGVMYH